MKAPQAVRIGAHEIKRRFGAVVANDRVSFAARAGSVHALVGANGAGKSTLMRMLQGLDRPDEGHVISRGAAVRLRSPADAFAQGIGMVHQEFMLAPELTLLENLVLAREPVRAFGRLDRRAALARAQELAGRAGVELDWGLAAQDAPVHQRQALEILRLLHREADVLILDEPTAVLAPAQVRQLLELMRRLRDEGRTLLFISHKLHEVMAVADDITVLRAGRAVVTLRREDADEARLADLMVGPVPVPPAPAARGGAAAKTLLAVEGLAARDGRGHLRLAEASFELRAGEILGIAGVAGSGQDELVGALVGLQPAEQGRVRLEGADLEGLGVGARRLRGLGYVSPDRAAEGLCLDAPIRDNATVATERRRRYVRAGLLRRRVLNEHVGALLDRFEVRRQSDAQPVRGLSGGNQQRVAMARELDCAPRVLLAVQPTRGIDLLGIAHVHARLREQADAGGAVLLVSEELDELLALSDRIAVLHGGRLVGIVERGEAQVERIGRMMLGAAA
ncbi:MAG: ABC transporter ATP-binding protein [Burkholderiales bacterium]|nr:ABC transporter ATP-binding protein [Burkholderiales bacterium]